MGLYVFSCASAVDAEQCAMAEQALIARGSTVVKSLAGVLLVELAPQTLTQVAKLLPDWRWSPQRETARPPEYRQRVRTITRARELR